jgi:hypothetical protein
MSAKSGGDGGNDLTYKCCQINGYSKLLNDNLRQSSPALFVFF